MNLKLMGKKVTPNLMQKLIAYKLQKKKELVIGLVLDLEKHLVLY